MRVTFPLIPAAYTSTASVQVSGIEDLRLLAHCGRLPCDSCSPGQCFAFGFLQIPPRDGHPCRSANRSPCRADSGLSPPSHPATTMCTGTAPCLAHVGAAHVRPADHPLPNDRRRAMCPEGARHGEALKVTGRTTSVEVTAYGPSITSCPNGYHQFECGGAEAEFNENLTRIRHG